MPKDNLTLERLSFLNKIRKNLKEIATRLNRDEDAVSTQINHLNNIEFLILNQDFIVKSGYKNFGEGEAKKHAHELKKPEFARSLSMHFELLGSSKNAKISEIDEQIETVFSAYTIALEKKRLESFFASVGYGACIQAKTAHLLAWKAKIRANQQTLNDLMHEYLWCYGPSGLKGDLNNGENDELMTMIQILTHHRGEKFITEKGSTGIINFEVVKDYLVNVNYYDEQSFANVPNSLKQAKSSVATDTKPASRGFFKNHWKSILIGSAVGLGLALTLVGVGILTGGAVPLFIAGVAATHLLVSHVAAIAIGASTVALTTTAAGAGSGAIIGTIYDKVKTGSTKHINKSLGVEVPQPIPVFEDEFEKIKPAGIPSKTAANDEKLTEGSSSRVFMQQ